MSTYPVVLQLFLESFWSLHGESAGGMSDLHLVQPRLKVSHSLSVGLQVDVVLLLLPGSILKEGRVLFNDALNTFYLHQSWSTGWNEK